MHFTFNLTQIGNSVGIILPKEALAALKLKKGDTIHLSETPDGFQLTPYDPVLAEQLELGREFMHEYRDAFHALAKVGDAV